ncbi:MAG: hypothetical protein LBU51_00760, partial [Bacteroidales bacterium]|nr:hypothetical protein [Bacteroidales bacterium]
MANVIDFIINLQDKFSAKIYKISESGNMLQKSFANAVKTTNTAKFGFDTLGTSADTLRQKIQELRNQRDIIPIGELKTIRQYNSEINKLERQLGKVETLNGGWLKTKTSEAFSSIPSFLKNPVVAVGAVIGGSIKQGMENELQKANISTLLNGDTVKTD